MADISEASFGKYRLLEILLGLFQIVGLFNNHTTYFILQKPEPKTDKKR